MVQELMVVQHNMGDILQALHLQAHQVALIIQEELHLIMAVVLTLAEDIPVVAIQEAEDTLQDLVVIQEVAIQEAEDTLQDLDHLVEDIQADLILEEVATREDLLEEVTAEVLVVEIQEDLLEEVQAVVLVDQVEEIVVEAVLLEQLFISLANTDYFINRTPK